MTVVVTMWVLGQRETSGSRWVFGVGVVLAILAASQMVLRVQDALFTWPWIESVLLRPMDPATAVTMGLILVMLALAHDFLTVVFSVAAISTLRRMRQAARHPGPSDSHA